LLRKCFFGRFNLSGEFLLGELFFFIENVTNFDWELVFLGKYCFGKTVMYESYSNDKIHDVTVVIFDSTLNVGLTCDVPVVFRIFWAVTVACAVLLATYAIVESWKTYDRGSIDTVVETTFFNYADIAFPMVTVCDSSRVDWERVTRLTAQYVATVIKI